MTPRQRAEAVAAARRTYLDACARPATSGCTPRAKESLAETVRQAHAGARRQRASPARRQPATSSAPTSARTSPLARPHTPQRRRVPQEPLLYDSEGDDEDAPGGNSDLARGGRQRQRARDAIDEAVAGIDRVTRELAGSAAAVNVAHRDIALSVGVDAIHAESATANSSRRFGAAYAALAACLQSVAERRTRIRESCRSRDEALTRSSDLLQEIQDCDRVNLRGKYAIPDAYSRRASVADSNALASAAERATARFNAAQAEAMQRQTTGGGSAVSSPVSSNPSRVRPVILSSDDEEPPQHAARNQRRRSSVTTAQSAVSWVEVEEAPVPQPAPPSRGKSPVPAAAPTMFDDTFRAFADDSPRPQQQAPKAQPVPANTNNSNTSKVGEGADPVLSHESTFAFIDFGSPQVAAAHAADRRMSGLDSDEGHSL